MTPKKRKLETRTLSFKLLGPWTWLDDGLKRFAEMQALRTGGKADVSSAIRYLLAKALEAEGIRKPKE